jgi:hypothetical protein
MTLVAAFKINGVPVIVADMLITDEPGTGPHNYLPTRPVSADPGPTERRRSGARRKVSLFGNNLIVAFTGTVNAGSTLFADLERRFVNSTATADQLSFGFRLHPSTQSSLGCRVVG